MHLGPYVRRVKVWVMTTVRMMSPGKILGAILVVAVISSAMTLLAYGPYPQEEFEPDKSVCSCVIIILQNLSKKYFIFCREIFIKIIYKLSVGSYPPTVYYGGINLLIYVISLQ